MSGRLARTPLFMPDAHTAIFWRDCASGHLLLQHGADCSHAQYHQQAMRLRLRRRTGIGFDMRTHSALVTLPRFRKT